MDLLTTDTINLDLHLTENRNFNIDEETPGWYFFVNKMNENLDIPDKGWLPKVVYPPFERNETVIYSKQ